LRRRLEHPHPGGVEFAADLYPAATIRLTLEHRPDLGWGVSWWLPEQGIHPVRDVVFTAPDQRLRLIIFDFYEADAAG
jgi:hypothetical protein